MSRNIKKLKKPYLKKYGTISGFSVWIVDGNYIRGKIDEEFTNCGEHYRFKFIPKKEFWIDKKHGNGEEEKYFIEKLLTENRLMAKGICYETAIDRADRVERRERNKHERISREMKKLLKIAILKRIHKKLLKKYSKKLKVWIVNGRFVRDLLYIDFTEGGHDKVYSFVPEGEVWIDNDLSPREIKFVVLHEVHERNLMGLGKSYESAHRDSSRIEFFCRNHPEKLKQNIQKELKKIA